jgi:hypothetical protein
MKRIAVLFVALAFAGGLAAGCSKDEPAAAPSVPGVPDVGNIQADAAKCTELATTWASVFTPLATGSDADKEKAQKQIEDLKGQVPDSVKGDLDKISTGLGDAKDMTALATYLGSAEFTTANTNVTNYLTVECTKIGS